jgi:phage terminase large subunit-like protein
MQWPAHTSDFIRDNVDPESRAGQILLFILSLKVPDGYLAGQPFKVADFQAEAIINAYPGQPDDKRIVTTALLTIPRKNGKTALIAALLLCHLCGPEAVAFGQLYSIAFDRGQASVVYNLARNMVTMDHELMSQINITESEKTLTHFDSGSVFKALSSEGRAHHGKSSSFLVFDELAQFGQNDEMYSVMTTSQGAHMGNAMTWIISTQAPDDSALLSQLIDTYKDNHNPKFYCKVWAAPDGCDPFDEQVWHDCNPALKEGFRSYDELLETAQRAKEIPSLQARFENLYLNRRISADAFFIAPQLWRENGGKLDITKYFERECVAGLDLSQKNDLSALALYFNREDDEPRDACFLFFWKPGDTIAEHARRDIVPYDLWVSQGHIETTPGSVIDYRYIVERLKWIDENFKLLELGFDRWKIADLQRYAEDADLFINMRPIGQGFKDMSPCCEAIEDVLLRRELNHGDNPVMTWNASNAVVVTDPTGARKLDKSKSRNRIDGMVALSMAARLASSVESEGDYFDYL